MQDLPVNDRAASVSQWWSSFLQIEAFHPGRTFIKTQEIAVERDSDQESCFQALWRTPGPQVPWVLIHAALGFLSKQLQLESSLLYISPYPHSCHGKTIASFS